MRAIMHHEFANPAEVLTVEEIATPEPGPGQVRVRTVLATIHNHDLMTISGQYGFKPELPARAGTEAVGVVDALGEGVDGLSLGQRVCSSGTFGVWAEYFIAPAAGLLPVPDGIPDEAAAQLVAMPMSAITLLDSVDVSRGDWLVQNAANGAVGRLVAQLGAGRGLNILGLVRRAAGVGELASQGIARVVATDQPDWRDQVRALVGDAQIRVGIDSVGGPASGQLMSLLGEGGTLVNFGAMDSATVQVSSGDLIFKQCVVKGFWASKVIPALSGEHRQRLIAELLTDLAAGTITLPVEHIYSFDDVRQASAANYYPGRVGKVLLRP